MKSLGKQKELCMLRWRAGQGHRIHGPWGLGDRAPRLSPFARRGLDDEVFPGSAGPVQPAWTLLDRVRVEGPWYTGSES